MYKLAIDRNVLVRSLSHLEEVVNKYNRNGGYTGHQFILSSLKVNKKNYILVVIGKLYTAMFYCDDSKFYLIKSENIGVTVESISDKDMEEAVFNSIIELSDIPFNIGMLCYRVGKAETFKDIIIEGSGTEGEYDITVR